MFARWWLRAGMMLCILMVFGFYAADCQAQQQFGVHYHPRTEIEDLQADLTLISEMEINRLMVEVPFPDEQLRLISDYDFTIAAFSGIQYPTQHRLEYRSGEFNTAISQISELLNYDLQIDQILYFRHGAIKSEGFRELVQPHVNQADRPANTIGTFLTAHPPEDEMLQVIPNFILEVSTYAGVTDWEQIFGHNGFAGIYYNPDEQEFDLRDFQNIMEVMENHRQLPVYFDWEWFVINVNEDPFISEVIEAYATDPDAVFPNPAEEDNGIQANILILILLILWGSVIVHYVFVPPYQKSLYRFFLTHSFFVADIIYRRIRIGFPNIIVLLQQGLLAGVFVNGILFHYLSDLGREAITHNLLFLSEIPNPLTTFLLAFFGVISLNLLFMLWIYLVHRHIQAFTQIAVIVLWPQHVNLLFISLMMALLAAGITGGIITVLSILYVIVLFGSFLLAAIDASRFIYIRFYYYPLTAGLFIIALVLIYIYLLSGNGYVHAWELATSLS